MKYILLILFSIFLTKNDENQVDDFINKMNHEIGNYKEVGSVKQIPRGVFKTINKWKKLNFSAIKTLDSKIERKMFKFELAEINEPYNIGCIIENQLPQRQLVFAAQNNSEWLIIYKHSNGGAGIQTKMLHLDIEKSEKLSLFKIHQHVLNKIELVNYLRKIKSQNVDVLKNKIILIFGETLLDDHNPMYKGLAV